MRKLLSINAFIFAMTIVAAVIAVSCQKEKLADGTFSATMEGHTNHHSKVVFVNPSFNWIQGDCVCAARQTTTNGPYETGIYCANTVSTNNVATLSFQSGNDVTNEENFHGEYFYAYSPASIYNEKSASTNRITLPASYSTDINGNLVGPPMYTESTNKYLEFKNLCGMVCIKIATPSTNTYITKIKLTTDKKVRGTFDVTYNGTTPSIVQYGAPTEAEKSVVLNTLTNIISNGHEFFIPLPEGVYHTLVIKMYTADGKVCTKTMTSPNKLNIIRSQYTVVDLTDITLDFVGAVGAKGGYFSVSGDTKIQFSQGNLQYRARKQNSDSTNTWRFAINQYGRIFTDNWTTNPDARRIVEQYYIEDGSSTEWVDLFGWGTNAITGPFPYSLSTNNNTYGPYIATQRYDWGANCITNGGNQQNLWRTLTNNEWDYLFNQRGNNLWTKATVCNTSGVILLPDDWVCPTNVPALSFASNVTYADNSIDETRWLLLEASGCIFLPVTGILSYNLYSQQYLWTIGQTSKGFYWSFSTNGSDSAYRLKFDNNTIDCMSSSVRRNGNAVRLVRDVSMAEWQQNN